MIGLHIQKNIPLAPYTTFGIGGPAEFFVTVQNRGELEKAVAFAREKNLSITVLGGGSNVLIADAGIKGLVVKNEIQKVTFTEEGNEVLVTVGAGVPWDELVLETVSKGLWGIENLSGIPGTVGGAVVQNINAYGVTLEACTETVDTLHVESGTPESFTKDQCAFAYRNSFFKEKGKGKEYVVTGVTMRLSRRARVQDAYKSASQSMQHYFAERRITEPTAADVRSAILEVRRRIGMLAGQHKSAGSFFTNVIIDSAAFARIARIIREKYPEKSAQFSPWHWEQPDGTVKVSTAFLMECTAFNKTAFKGKTYNGTVAISPVHTLALVNAHNATANDVRSFARVIAKNIFDTFGVQLSSEVCFL